MKLPKHKQATLPALQAVASAKGAGARSRKRMHRLSLSRFFHTHTHTHLHRARACSSELPREPPPLYRAERCRRRPDHLGGGAPTPRFPRPQLLLICALVHRRLTVILGSFRRSSCRFFR